MPKFSYKNRIRHRHVFTSDSVLLDRLAENKPLTLVGNHFSEEPYGFGVPKGDEKFLQLVNLTLQEMAADGTLAAIYFKWFQGAIHPFPIPSTPKTDNAELVALAKPESSMPYEPAPRTPLPRIHVVQRGDTLSTLAGKFYGDIGVASWQRIFEANREIIGDDPYRMELTIPQ